MATVTVSLRLNIQMDTLPTIPNQKRNQFQDQEQEVMTICHLSFIFIFIRVRNLQGHRRWLFPATRTTAMAIKTRRKAWK